jgi:hypothetical protein
MRRRASYLFVLLIILLSGCTLEQKLAKNFVKQKPGNQIILLAPSYLFKTNLKTYDIPGVDSLDEFTKDSLLLDKSLFLKNITDSLIINQFIIGFQKYLEKCDATVIPEKSIDTVMARGGHPYFVNIAQLGLEEYVHPYSSEEVVFDEVLTIDGFDVNAINYNAWIEVSRLNSEKMNKVLFNSDMLTDDVNGVMKQNLFSGNYTYNYSIDTITPGTAYDYSRYFGYWTAAKVFDYMMNNYVFDNLPVSYPYVPYYYHYDPDHKILSITDENDRIIELDNK